MWYCIREGYHKIKARNERNRIQQIIYPLENCLMVLLITLRLWVRWKLFTHFTLPLKRCHGGRLVTFLLHIQLLLMRLGQITRLDEILNLSSVHHTYVSEVCESMWRLVWHFRLSFLILGTLYSYLCWWLFVCLAFCGMWWRGQQTQSRATTSERFRQRDRRSFWVNSSYRDWLKSWYVVWWNLFLPLLC